MFIRHIILKCYAKVYLFKFTRVCLMCRITTQEKPEFKSDCKFINIITVVRASYNDYDLHVGNTTEDVFKDK